MTRDESGNRWATPAIQRTWPILVEGEEDVRDPKHRKIYFLRRIPRDPMHPDASVPAADTWAKRAYASEPDNPQEGEDVYDVHSKSSGIGLNGVPYRQW